MTTLPEPLTPIDCDLRGMDFLPLEAARLLESDLWDKSTGDELKAALGLWCKAWRQIPAGSIPDDDETMRKWAAGWGLDWAVVKARALHGFVKCSDGRLYHPVVCQKALEAWDSRVRYRERKENDRIAKREARAAKSAKPRRADKKKASAKCPQDIAPTSPERPPEIGSKTGDSGQGTEERKESLIQKSDSQIFVSEGPCPVSAREVFRSDPLPFPHDVHTPCGKPEDAPNPGSPPGAGPGPANVVALPPRKWGA